MQDSPQPLHLQGTTKKLHLWVSQRGDYWGMAPRPRAAAVGRGEGLRGVRPPLPARVERSCQPVAVVHPAERDDLRRPRHRRQRLASRVQAPRPERARALGGPPARVRGRLPQGPARPPQHRPAGVAAPAQQRGHRRVRRVGPAGADRPRPRPGQGRAGAAGDRQLHAGPRDRAGCGPATSRA